jgi:NADH-quinone oxidoreductase subunit G
MPKLTIDGKEIEVPAGTNLIEAARKLGIEIPHYCYHPGLSIAGQCRLCMVDIEKTPRPTIACNTLVAEGMVVDTKSERVIETRKSIMEFHLINHPLDCPVCDQAGECYLQIYYMRHGLYDPRMVDEKVHKPKALPIGPHVILDAERCILCSRCVRFCDEITHTGELGIFNRGDHSEIGLFPGTELANKYSGNVVDICPVGALLDRDFRFQVRVWYLNTQRSICPGCARGCNTEVHFNQRRPHHNDGRRVARLKPRFNADVNRWWICDEGRYDFRWIDDETRLTVPRRREGEKTLDVSWDDAITAAAGALARYRPEEIGVLASPRMSNEDLFVLRELLSAMGVTQVDYRVPPREPGYQDGFLIRADKNPNSRGAELIGLGQAPAADILAAARARRLKCLWVLGHDLLAGSWPEGEVLDALLGAEVLIFQGTNSNSVSRLAHVTLPAAAYPEREGTYTNFQGRVQRFRTAFEPLGTALPDWDIVGRIAQAARGLARRSRAEECFRALAAAVPAFADMTYRSVGESGQMVVGAAAEGEATISGASGG